MIEEFDKSTLYPLDEWMDYIIHEWLKTNLSQKKEMEASKHFFNPDKINPWHMEDSVWTHTMMVCTAYKSHFPSKYITFSQALVPVLSCVLHDYGKVLTRHLDHVKMKARFTQHGPHGVLNALEYTSDLLKRFEDKIYSLDERKNILERICYMTSRHMEYDNMADINKLAAFGNYSDDLVEDFYKFSIADCEGRIMLKERHDGKRSELIDLMKYQMEDIKEINWNYWDTNVNSPTIWIYCGIPGSGKDYQANQQNLKVFSYDKVRMDYYKNFSSTYNPKKSESETYSEAYEYFIEKNINPDTFLNADLKKHFNENGSLDNIAICNVNLSLKARKRILHNIRSVHPNAKVGCRFILTPLSQAVINDSTRESKNLGKDLIVSRFNELVLPTMLEGFSSVEYVTPYLN